MKGLIMFMPLPTKKRRVVVYSIIMSVLSICIVNMGLAQTPKVIEDNFEDGLLDPAIWETCSSDTSRYAIENNGRLEIHSSGVQFSAGDTHSMVNSRFIVPVDKDFHVKVSFRTRGSYRFANGRAVTPAPRGNLTSPGCTTYPDIDLSSRSLWNVLTAEAMAGRGVADSFTSMGTSFPLASTTISTSVPAMVRQKYACGSMP